MKEVLFFQHKKENILDHLIYLFKNKGGWKLNDSTHQFYHKFEWPDIILADRRRVLSFPKLDGNAIELLGSYTFNNFEKIGQVTLYKPAILSCAKDYLKASGTISINFEDTKKIIEILSEIILIHEFVHWLVEVGESPKLEYMSQTQKTAKSYGLNDIKYKGQINDFKYIDIDEISYHESFAQIFTNYFCNLFGGEHWAVFSWLQNQQPIQYVIYKDLFPAVWGGRDMIIDGVFPDQNIEIIEEKHLEQVFDLLNFTRDVDCQSFELLKVLSSNYSVDDKKNKCFGFCEKTIKAIELESACYFKIVEKCKLLHSDLVSKYKGRISGKKYGL